MLSQTNYERYIHYRDHIQNNINNINFIRLLNCKYCKQEKRAIYGSQFRTPNSRNNNTNINLRNYNRSRNTPNILPETQNLIDNYISSYSPSTPNLERYSPSTPNLERYNPSTPNLERYSPSTPNLERYSPSTPNLERYSPSTPNLERYNPSTPNLERYSPSTPNLERYSPSTPRYYIDRRTTNGIYRIPYSRSIQSPIIQEPIIEPHRIEQLSMPQRMRNNRPNIIRNNYTGGGLNVEYFRNNLGIVLLPPEEIDDFEEFVDVEVKTLLETVNRTSELEVYYGTNKEHCTICCDNINYSQIVRKLKCDHIFHYKCIDEWLETNTKCPNCRLNLLTGG